MIELKYFVRHEFDCPCCAKNNMNEPFLRKLDIARGLASIPFEITSGYRCKKHNTSLERASPNSSHMVGLAADIACTDATRFVIVKSLMDAGFQRIGIAKNFVHVDADLKKTQRVIWSYI